VNTKRRDACIDIAMRFAALQSAAVRYAENQHDEWRNRNLADCAESFVRSIERAKRKEKQG